MNDFWTFYMAAALSAAIFALFKLYLPAMEETRTKASNNPELKLKVKNLLDHNIFAAFCFLFFATVFAPMFIVPLLSDKMAATFRKNFIKGIS